MPESIQTTSAARIHQRSFGRYVRTEHPGPHIHLPYPIETVYKPKVSQVRQTAVGYRAQSVGGVFQQGRVQAVNEESAMLTGDENIINVQFNIQYQIKPDGAVDYLFNVIQPDLANTGGITETKKICDMAQVYDIGVQIHVCGGPIATAAALQVEAAIPNFTIHEEHNANLKNIFIQAGKYYYKPENGYYTVPDLPGIGQEMTDEFLATCRKVVIGG